MKKKIRNDIILIIGLLLIGIILYVVINNMATYGGSVEIQVDGNIVASYSLSTTRFNYYPV